MAEEECELRFKVHVKSNCNVLEAVQAMTHKLDTLGVKLMSQMDDLKAALAAEDAEIDQVLVLVAGEVAMIADLQQKLADALVNVAPDLSAQIADIQEQTAKLAAVLPTPVV